MIKILTENSELMNYYHPSYHVLFLSTDSPPGVGFLPWCRHWPGWLQCMSTAPGVWWARKQQPMCVRQEKQMIGCRSGNKRVQREWANAHPQGCGELSLCVIHAVDWDTVETLRTTVKTKPFSPSTFFRKLCKRNVLVVLTRRVWSWAAWLVNSLGDCWHSWHTCEIWAQKTESQCEGQKGLINRGDRRKSSQEHCVPLAKL